MDRTQTIAIHLQKLHNATMDTTSITIRNVPQQTRNQLAARAALSGRSLQKYLRAHLIEFARKPDPDDLLNRIRERKKKTGSQLSTETILRHRDVDRP